VLLCSWVVNNYYAGAHDRRIGPRIVLKMLHFLIEFWDQALLLSYQMSNVKLILSWSQCHCHPFPKVFYNKRFTQWSLSILNNLFWVICFPKTATTFHWVIVWWNLKRFFVALVYVVTCLFSGANIKITMWGDFRILWVKIGVFLANQY
jgi:hypothetical protein